MQNSVYLVTGINVYKILSIAKINTELFFENLNRYKTDDEPIVSFVTIRFRVATSLLWTEATQKQKKNQPIATQPSFNRHTAEPIPQC